MCLLGARRGILLGGEIASDLGRHKEREAETRARGVGFEDIVFHIERGDLLHLLERPNPKPYRWPASLGWSRREDYLNLVPRPAFARQCTTRAPARYARSASHEEADVEEVSTRSTPEDNHPVVGRPGRKSISVRSPTMKIDADEKALPYSVERGKLEVRRRRQARANSVIQLRQGQRTARAHGWISDSRARTSRRFKNERSQRGCRIRR